MNLYQAIALGSAALAVLAGAWNARRLRLHHLYSATVMLITAGGPALSLWLYLLATNLALKPAVSVGLFALGAVAGIAVSGRVGLSEVGTGEQIRVVGAAWLPLPAAVSVAALQVSGAAASLAFEVLALAALQATVAFGVASAVVLIVRRSNLAAASRPAAGLPGQAPPSP
jgi:hypothetical protein